MKIFGKELPVAKINFVMNVVSFIGGIIFLSRFFLGSAQSEIIVPLHNTELDSLIKIQTRLSNDVQELKTIQDSLVKSIGIHREKLNQQKKEITVKRQQLYSTIQSDWDGLRRSDKDAYVNKIMSNLKEKHK